MTTRRGFLGAILAAGFAPAAIGSGVLMPVRPPIWAPNIIQFNPALSMSKDVIEAWTRALEREVSKPSHWSSHLKDKEFYDGARWVGVDFGSGDRGVLVTWRGPRIVSISDAS